MKTFDLEGNELEYLPCCMLRMHNLKQMNVKNNYLHPLIWRKLLVNNAQVIMLLFYQKKKTFKIFFYLKSLFALSAIKFNELYGTDSEQFDNLSDEIKRKLRK